MREGVKERENEGSTVDKQKEKWMKEIKNGGKIKGKGSKGRAEDRENEGSTVEKVEKKWIKRQ